MKQIPSWRLVPLTLFSLLTLPACKSTPATGVVSPELPTSTASEGSAQKGNLPGAPNAKTPTDGAVNSNPDTSSPNKGMLLFSGGLSITGTGLYTLSTTSRQAIPVRFSGYDLQYLQPRPLPKAGRVAAIARDILGRVSDSIHLLNLETGQSYPVYNTKGTILSFSVSPDGQWIAFSEQPESARSGARIRLLNIKGEGVSDLANSDPGALYSDSEPQFSPDGQFLTFERQSSKKSAIMWLAFSSRQAGTPAEFLVAPEGARIKDFHFSSDRNTYAYLRQSGRTSRLVVRIAGQAEKTIDTIEGNVYEPTWSPDGRSLLFWTDSVDAQELKVLALESKAPTHIATFAIARGRDNLPVCPVWSADMKEVYFTGRSGPWEGIFKVSLGSRSVSRLTDPLLPTPFFCPRLLENSEERL